MIPRTVTPELIDRSEPDPDRLAESLQDLAWLNHWLGGTASVLHELKALLYGRDRRRLTVVDVGTGAADIPLAVAGWCAERGVACRAVALDRGRATVQIVASTARSHPAGASVLPVRGDARALPIRSGSVDIGICSTALHHFGPEEAVAVLRELARISFLGIVVSDLRRCWSGYLAARALAETIWRRHLYTRHDGPASMRSAYTLDEVRDLAERAGLTGCRIRPRPGFRWTLRWARAS